MFIYIKNGGTATGDAGRASTERTGSFATMGASAYYDSIYDVFNGVPTTAPAAGDIICVSHLHHKEYAAGITYLKISDGTSIYSVDDTSANTYKRGATEEVTALSESILIMDDTAAISAKSKGVNYLADAAVWIIRGANQTLLLEDCTIGITSSNSSRFIYPSQFDGATLNMLNVDLSFSHVDQEVRCDSRINWIGGSVLTSLNTLFKLGGSGRSNIILEDVDLTNLSTSISTLGSIISNNDFTFKINRCLLGSGTEIDSSTWVNNTGKITASSIGFGTASDTNNYFYEQSIVGTTSEDTATYRTAGAVDMSGNNFSANMVPTSSVASNRPLEFELSNFYVDTSSFTSTITFEVAFCLEGTSAPSALDDSEFYIRVEYTDGADNALGVIVDNQADIFATPTTHTTTTGEWTAGANNVQMTTSIELTIGTSSGNIGSGICRVLACVATDIDTRHSGDLLFVDRKVELS